MNKTMKTSQAKQLAKLREANRDYVTGKPAMFTELERLCKRIQKASITQLSNWARRWPNKIAAYANLHERHSKAFDEESSPWLRKIIILKGAFEYLKGEVQHRITGSEPVDVTAYDPDKQVTSVG